MENARIDGGTEVRSVGIAELRDGLSQHVAAVRAGTEITITDHGRPVARIIPVENDLYAQLVATGRLLPARDRSMALPDRPAVGPVSDLIER